MDCGDGVMVNVCTSDDDCSNSDNGPKLATANRPQLFAYSDSYANNENVKPSEGTILKYVTPTGNVTVNLLHPQSYEILAKVQDSISNDVATSDNTDSPQSSTKSLIENVENRTNSIEWRHDPPSEQKSRIDSEDNLQNVSHKQQHQTIETHQIQHRESISCIEESTEVLLINSADCNDKYFGGCGHAYSATDSDVEVLMSEEIGESDWSAGGTATEDNSTEDHILDGTTTKAIENPTQKQNKASGNNMVKNDSTDQEISIEDSNHSCSLSNSENLDKDKLLKIIGEQAASIHKLKSAVERYRRAHLMLYKHAEAIQYTIDLTDEDLEKIGFPHKVRP